ncbi:MAG TPA: hypothetical protein VEH77_04250 [Roseiarcus sp.]|nr:hypothetical protein [Roseiarcus sp.]
MKHIAVAALALFGAALALEGCGGAMGLGVGVVTRAAGTGDAYAAWKASAPPIPSGSGRLFVYAPSRQVSIWTADWATGGEFVFDVDRDVCDVIGSSFAYVDLPAGVHSLSASEIKKFNGFQIGKYVTTVKIAGGKTTFARIDPVPGAPTLVTFSGPAVRLTVVGNREAEEEMAKLPLDTHVASFSCKPRAAEDRGT